MEWPSLELANSSSRSDELCNIHTFKGFLFQVLLCRSNGKAPLWKFRYSHPWPPITYLGLKAQGRALVSMIGMIVRCLDDFSAFTEHIQRLGMSSFGPPHELGGRHNIYGVQQKDYVIFSQILSETIADLTSGTAEMDTGEVQATWNKVDPLPQFTHYPRLSQASPPSWFKLQS